MARRASSVPCSSTRSGRNKQQAISKPERKWKTLVFGRLEGGGLRIEEMQEQHEGEKLGRRVRIRHALSGNRLCFPGPATAKNEWSVPGQIFKVGELLGRNVLNIEGGKALENEQLTVSAVLTREGEIAPGSFFLQEVDRDGWVFVLTGPSILPFKGLKCEEKPCASLDEVKTPRTPPAGMSPRCTPMLISKNCETTYTSDCCNATATGPPIL